MSEPIDRIVIFEDKIRGDLSRCNICQINFTAIQPCIVCSAIIEKQNKLGRRLNKEEFEELREWFMGVKGGR